MYFLILALVGKALGFGGIQNGLIRRHSPVVKMSSEEVDFDSVAHLSSAEERMKKSMDALKGNLASLRTGRASPDILSRVLVDYYGAETPLNQLASISVSGGTQLIVSPYDKSAIKEIDSALIEANLGMTPSNDGEIIRLNIPPLTEERRKEILKQAKAIGEESKVAIRNIRRSSNDDVKKKSKDLSEDLVKQTESEIQKLTDSYIKEIDSVLADKEKDIMTV
mmetsp:Transcript_20584/g.26665  ORF Transcript_20584/g.26665 Transcript_20584/m.26665 type:complete len:223 (-) Transcript_20584:1206-1874(-)